MICAPTAVAAQLFDKGTTIHTLMGYLEGRLQNLTTMKGGRGTEIRNQFSNGDLLIQDEFSMLTQELEEKIIKRAKECRDNDFDFGDIPIVILSGKYINSGHYLFT
jgi:hypothetical protein